MITIFLYCIHVPQPVGMYGMYHWSDIVYDVCERPKSRRYTGNLFAVFLDKNKIKVLWKSEYK